MFKRQKLICYILHSLLLIKNSRALTKKNITRSNVTNREFGYFWHVSDVFFDPEYSPLGAPEDDCHIKNSANFTRNCGFFGELGQCSAFGLMETIARAMNDSTRWKNIAPEFCIFTGNLRCPNVKNRPEDLYETMRAFVTDIKNAGFLNIYPSYGWYDYYPHGHHPLTLNALYDRVKSLFRDEEGLSILRESIIPSTGYYSHIHQKPNNRVRIIVMNTNFYVKNHIASSLPDPAGQWSWLIEQLRGCRITGQKAFIVMSVPPGFNKKIQRKGKKPIENPVIWSNRHNRRYLQIINNYYDVIAAQFGGHQDQDTFRLIYNKNGKAISAILLAPPTTPRFETYPTMRIYMYEKNTGKLVDFVQYYFNLTKANLDADMTRPEKYWEVDYSFRDFYRLPDATTNSLKKLVENLKNNDAIFKRYHSNAEGFRDKKHNCDYHCRIISLCVITSIDFGSFYECISGEFFEDERRVLQFPPPSKSLRDRLIRRNSNSLSTSSAVSSLNRIIKILCATGFASVLS